MKKTRLIIDAGAFVAVPIPGSFCRLNKANVDVICKNVAGRGGMIEVPLSAGQSFAVPFIFEVLEFHNNSAETADIEIIVGDGSFNDQQISGEVSIKTPVGGSTASDIIVAGGTAEVVLNPNPLRKKFIITSVVDNSDVVRVAIGSNADSTRGIELSPGMSFELESTAQVSVYAVDPSTSARIARVEVTS